MSGITCIAGAGDALNGLPADYKQGLEMSNSPSVTCQADFGAAVGVQQTQKFDMNLGVS